MKLKDIDNFFNGLSKSFKSKADIILIGGAAAAVLGGARPTLDVDFEARLSNPDEWEIFQQAVNDSVKKSGVNAQFAEEIERWSEITLLDYRQHKKLYKKFGNITVWILDSKYWSIGKIARYWDQDVQDILAVFKIEKPDPRETLQIWKRALGRSPKSSSLFLVKKQIIHFFSTHGKQIWGHKFDSSEITKDL